MAVIHMDPIITNDAHTDALRMAVAEKVKSIDPRLTIHDFRTVPGSTHTNLIFDVVVPYDVKLTADEVRRRIEALVKELDEAGFGELEACVGEKLGSPEERVFIGSVAEAARQSFDSLAVLLVTNPEPRTLASAGLPDDAFTRGKAPMTKSEVRAVILSKLQIHRHDVVFDVGAGTGSVSVEAALLASAGQVYAVEVEEEACRLIEENARQQGTSNLQVIHGSAPQALTDLPAPDVAFIGGSKGNLRAIMETLLAANPSCRIVASAVTLETIAEATTCFNELGLRDVEAVTVSVSRSRKLGGYHLLTAQNPILILSGTGDGGPTVGETDPLCFEEDR